MTSDRRNRPATEASECRSCGALILWCEWPSGKRMPVDVAPAFDGNVVLTLRRSENKLLAEKYVGTEHVGRKRYASHFSTCPNASQHRGAR
jgi:hypothetical protein